MNLKPLSFTAALALCCMNASAQHSTDFGARSYNLGVTLSGKESIAVSADNKLGTYYYKPLQGLQVSRENMLDGSTYLTELTLGRSVFKELVKEPEYESYKFETGNLFNIGLGFYYGYTINKGKRFQVPLYLGGSLDYFRGGWFKNLSLDLGFKLRAKFYLTDQIGLFAGFNPSMGFSAGKQTRQRIKQYAEVGIIFSPFEQKHGFDVVASSKKANPKASSDTRTMEQLFNDGLKVYDGHYHTYTISNPKKKFIKEAHMASLVKDKGYRVITSNSITANRLGDRTMVLNELTFIKPGDYPEYVFKKLGTHYESGLPAGSFLRPAVRDVLHPVNGSKVLSFRSKETYFEDWNNVMWTGEIKDGYLHGKGQGYYNSGDLYYIFTGTFNHGLAVSDITVRTYRAGEDGDYAIYLEKETVSSFGPQGVRVLADQYTDAANGVVKNAVRLNMIDAYPGYADRLEKAYADLRPVSATSTTDQFKPDPVISDFLTLYRTCGYDPRNLIPKAGEMDNVNEVLAMLGWTPRKDYYGFSLWSILSMVPEWYDETEKADREKLDNALALAKNGAKTSTCGFKTFFSDATRALNKKKGNFESYIAAQYREYNAARSAAVKNINDLHSQMEREIDESRSYAPKGELVSTSLVFNSKFRYKEDGVIYTKHGNHFAQYNVYYNKYGSEYELDCYMIHYASGKLEPLKSMKFKSYDEMVKQILATLQ